ncbi:MAG: hypothetical protein E6J75_19550 [Deltaproteobacteria bacterium]|nr:MAG: hypothetical protein E6J75_19550 [Deltaproteobacteria bacterium]
MKAVGRFETLAGVVLLTLTAAIAGLLLLGKPRPLAVVAASPRPGAVEVPVETQLTITFSWPVGSPRLRRSAASGRTPIT